MSDTSKKTAFDPAAAAKPAAAPKPKPDPKAAGKPKPGPKDKPEKQLRPLHTYAGTVGAFGANPDGVYDRFALETAGAPARTVKFPPHFGEALRALAQPGQEVAVLGYLHPTPKGEEHLHLARLDAAGTSARPAAPGAPAAVTLTGTIGELLHTPKGDLHGLRLAGHETELRLPPHLGQQLAGRLVPGAAITASGPQRAPRPGEVAAHPAPMQVELLTLGPDNFLLH
ncbi:hypothetical protein [Hymenobacter bucti]|uniref:Uncharacterized protein n=1 Tax=Hymenobacter bucti TaxID=1844114 RepID=A0ABW4QU30_9BACT